LSNFKQVIKVSCTAKGNFRLLACLLVLLAWLAVEGGGGKQASDVKNE